MNDIGGFCACIIAAALGFYFGGPPWMVLAPIIVYILGTIGAVSDETEDTK